MPAPDLRKRLLDWVRARFSSDRETLFEPEALLAWLDEIDPEGLLVSTPGDLLAP